MREAPLKWIEGDRANVDRLWSVASAVLIAERDRIQAAYKAAWPSQTDTRLDYEARVDALAATLGKAPETFLPWLAEFSAAANESIGEHP